MAFAVSKKNYRLPPLPPTSRFRWAATSVFRAECRTAGWCTVRSPPLATPINQIYEDSIDLRRFPGRVGPSGFRRSPTESVSPLNPQLIKYTKIPLICDEFLSSHVRVIESSNRRVIEVIIESSIIESSNHRIIQSSNGGWEWEASGWSGMGLDLIGGSLIRGFACQLATLRRGRRIMKSPHESLLP